MPINPLGATYSEDITEDFNYNITRSRAGGGFTPTDIAYDISINDLPFVISANNQTKYQRETAQYKKDQFDNSAEPGEQSLLGWWIRSQTSFHNGAGITFYEPGADFEHVSYRFKDSRGIDVWTVGQASLLNDVFHSYTGANGIIAVSGNDGTNDVLVSGDSAGVLNKVVLNGDAVATPIPYTLFTTGVTHNSTYGFKSVTTDGSVYYAVCSTSIHKGSTTVADSVIYHLGTTPITSGAVIKYVKNYLLFGMGRTLYQLDPNNAALAQHTSNSTLPSTNIKTHVSTGWNWTDIVGGNRFIYASGRNNSKSEIWAVPYDDASVNLNLPEAFVVAELPFGEFVNSMYFYLGFLAVGTNKGVRIARVNDDGSIILGPLLYEVDKNVLHPAGIVAGVTGFVANDKYIWASTTLVGDDGIDNGCLVRVDLSTQFEDGTFPWAYDLQYQSDKDSYCTGVYYANDRLHLIINEPTELPAGEIQTQHSINKRANGWLQTGAIRYATVEPKFFKFLNVNGLISEGDGITVTTVDSAGNEFDLITLDTISIGSDLDIAQPATAIEQLSFKFTLINGSPLTSVPVLESYQVKSVPASRRQRLIQYPLSCYDKEMDRYNAMFGYSGRAFDMVTNLEQLEETADFVRVYDYRTDEQYTGLIEEVRFSNESSPDKDQNGFGGMLLVTVRKL